MRLVGFLGLGLVCATGACGTTPTEDDSTTFDCATATGADTFVVGLDKVGTDGAFDFKLMSVAPAPPARGNNNWIVQINSMSSGVVGDPVGSDATIVVTPYMPAHMHGTPVTVNITAMPTAGQFTLDPVNLWMPGIWQTTIAVTRSGTTDSAVYSFCLPD